MKLGYLLLVVYVCLLISCHDDNHTVKMNNQVQFVSYIDNVDAINSILSLTSKQGYINVVEDNTFELRSDYYDLSLDEVNRLDSYQFDIKTFKITDTGLFFESKTQTLSNKNMSNFIIQYIDTSNTKKNSIRISLINEEKTTVSEINGKYSSNLLYYIFDSILTDTFRISSSTLNIADNYFNIDSVGFIHNRLNKNLLALTQNRLEYKNELDYIKSLYKITVNDSTYMLVMGTDMLFSQEYRSINGYLPRKSYLLFGVKKTKSKLVNLPNIQKIIVANY